MLIPIDEVVHFDFLTHHPSTAAVTDADSTPTFDVYEEATDTGLLGATNATKRTSLTGNYRGSFTASAANGFEAGKWYNVIASATVNSIAGKGRVMHFRVAPAESQAGVPKSDLAYWLGTAPLALTSQMVQVSVGALQAAVITATSIASDAFTAAKFAADFLTSAKIADGALTAAKFASGAFDAVWSVATRLLTAGTNIVLAKGTGVTGFNDLSAAQVNAEADTALSDYDPPTRAELTSDTNSILSKLLKYVQLMVRKDAAIGTDNATEKTAINADGGSGAGAFNQATDSTEAIRDRGDAAWTTATGFSTHSAADVWAVGTRTLTSFGTLVSDIWAAGTRTLTAFDSSFKTGYALSSAGVQAIWDALTSALTTVGSIGKLLVDNINATISSRLPTSSYTAPLDAAGTRSAVGLASANLDTQLSALAGFIDTEVALLLSRLGVPAGASTAADIAAISALVAAIKAKTDGLTFTVAGNVDANVQRINDTQLQGDGSVGTPWGPV